MTSEDRKPETKLRPDAPPYIPLSRCTVQVSKEPQCSRYSRRTVRRDMCPNSPRPILGTKIPFPRPILGRTETSKCDSDDEDDYKEYIGKEFRSIYRRMQRMKVNDENDKNSSNTPKCH